MKKTITHLLLVAALALPGMAAASTSYTMRGVEFKADTLFHAQIGPGTTQTSLFLRNEESQRQMYLYYSRVDLTNPYVTLRTVSGQDKLFGTERVSDMAKRRTKPGERYYFGVNGDFFTTSGVSKRGESMVGAPTGPCIGGGEVYRARNHNTRWALTLNATKDALIGHAEFGGSVTRPDGKSVSLGGINTYAGNDAIYLYNPYYLAGTNETGDCSEVQVRLAAGESFRIGQPFKVVVTGNPSSATDMDIPADGYVLHGQGSKDFGGVNAKSFVAGLKPGDMVEVNFTVSIDGKSFVPTEMIASLPMNLRNGEVVDDEYLLDEFKSNQPICAVGLADGGKTAVFMMIDGRSPISSGARPTETGEMLRQLGCTDGLSFDSGGSATFYTSALGVRNKPSDGVERPDGNGVFAVSSAPDDSTVAAISFVDWSVEVPKYGIYKPKFFGYNKYGMLIDTDLKGVKLSCPESVGHVRQDSIFFGDGNGFARLVATYGGSVSTDVPLTIVGSDATLSLVNDSIINDGYRRHVVAVQNTADGRTLAVDPAVLTWSSSNESVVRIDASTGSLLGVANGTATVTGRVGSFSGDMRVNVEIPSAHAMPIDPALDVTTWKYSQTGGKHQQLSATADGNGIAYTYTGASGRTPKITLTKALRLWSLPDTVRLRINPGDAPLKNAIFNLKANGRKAAYHTVVPETVVAGQEITLDLPTSSWLDTSDMGAFPITLNSIALTMGASTVGKQYTIMLNGIETVYAPVPVSGVETVIDNATRFGVSVTAAGLQFSQPVDNAELWSADGRLLARGSGLQLTTTARGLCVLTATVGGKRMARKVVIK